MVELYILREDFIAKSFNSGLLHMKTSTVSSTFVNDMYYIGSIHTNYMQVFYTFADCFIS